MKRVLTAACLAFVLIVLAAPSQSAESGLAARVAAGAKAAAEARGLPPMAFVRLIWRESRFNPRAVSHKGAQGIAQFMPGTAADRGLDDPFEPKSAIVHSASLLQDLRAEFGNFGLAAAAYNAGAERVRGWLKGGWLPGETRAYVQYVTGLDAETWKEPDTELPDKLKMAGAEVLESCRKLAPLVVRAVYESEPLTASGAWRPWGAHVSTAFSKSKALAQFARLKTRYGAVLADRDPFVAPQRNLSRGRRSLYTVQIGADSRADADRLCAQLRARGGACIVQKN